MRIYHIIAGLHTGGTEMMVYKLLSHMKGLGFDNQVISLTDIGAVGEEVQASGISVRALGMRRGLPNPISPVRLVAWLIRERPQLVQTWLYDADLIGGLAARLSGTVPVVWGVRHTNLDPSVNKAITIRVAKTCAKLSRWIPTKIVCCSNASAEAHSRLGYAADRMVVIPNGFDLGAFSPDSPARAAVREELGVPPYAPVVGLVARWHPQKDHANFFAAAGLLARDHPDVHFVLCGDGITWGNAELARLVKEAGVGDQTHLLGVRTDVARLNAAMDVASSSSLGESFPNAVGEAMATGVPCVVTAVGASAEIVAGTGRVVPPGNPELLASAWREIIQMPESDRSDLGIQARARVEECFDIRAVVRRYAELYEDIVGAERRNLFSTRI